MAEENFSQCKCYKVRSLAKSLLGANEISNLKGQYVLGNQLGCGQFGIIRECINKQTGDILACKSIAKEKLITDEDLRSIKLEIEIMTKLSQHPNIVGLVAVYEEEEYVHLVMELCEGGELFIQLESHGRFLESEAKNLFKQLMEVVMYCHNNGIVHRDLKPENILLATKSRSSPIKLADFGLATYIKPGENLHGVVGSPFYIAPEVLSRGYNEAADVWSAGVVLYILLSGVPPFWGKTKSRIFEAVKIADLRFSSDPWDNVSYSAKELIKGMLCIDPCKRLTAKQVLDHSWLKGDTDELLNKEIKTESCEEKVKYTLMSRNEDISFNTGGINEVFTLKNDENIEFTSAMVSMPSFSFFGSECVVEGGGVCRIGISVNTRKVEEEEKVVVVKRGGGGRIKRNGRRIGLGEVEQLDLMMTESVIRWASCTHLSNVTASTFPSVITRLCYTME